MCAALVLFVQTGTVVLDNDYVRVTRDGARCAPRDVPGCGDRVIVALGATELRSGGSRRMMARGDIAVFRPGEVYEPPTGGPFFEVAIKPDHPPGQSPKQLLPAEKNEIRYDGERFFIFEERLEPGETRARHSHSQRVVMQLNRTRLQQWPDGEPALVRDIEPDRAGFNAAVIHVVKNIGDLPLRGIVIEFKPMPRTGQADVGESEDPARRRSRLRRPRLAGFAKACTTLSYEGILRRWLVHPNVSETPRDPLCYSIVK